jgi:uncharacterized protein YgiM (DUF1202 family)
MPRILTLSMLAALLLVSLSVPIAAQAIQAETGGMPLAPSGADITLLGCPRPGVKDIYVAPGDGHTIFDWLLPGTCVFFDKRSSDNQWIHIDPSESQVRVPGWVRADQVVLEANLESLPLVEIFSRVDNSVQACVVNTPSLNIRNGPGTRWREAGHLLEGECFDLDGRNSDKSWAKFGRGWVSTYYLQISGDLASLPVVKAPPPDLSD